MWFWIILIVVLIALLGGVVYTYGVAWVVYRDYLTRQPELKGKKYLRYECAFPDHAISMQMFKEGMQWQEQHLDAIRQVAIENEGLKLAGEFFDFGFDRTVIILAGRGEACSYGYYFAQPYQDLGYNVLVVDNRSTGESDGVYNCVGMKEYRDIIAWMRFLEKETATKRILLHGICIGSATGLYVMTSKDCPESAMGLIAEGMYCDFQESFKNHMIEINKPVFPVLQEAMSLIFLHSGHHPKRFCPNRIIKKMDKPILMLYGRQDQYSKPDKSVILYKNCPSPTKKLVWFDEGDHSHLRIMAPEEYDRQIAVFLEEQFGEHA